MSQTMMHKDNYIDDLSPEELYKQQKEKTPPLVDEYFGWVKNPAEGDETNQDRQGIPLFCRAGAVFA